MYFVWVADRDVPHPLVGGPEICKYDMVYLHIQYDLHRPLTDTSGPIMHPLINI